MITQRFQPVQYWSGDPREGFHYNELVNIKDLPDLDLESGDSEHIIDYIYHSSALESGMGPSTVVMIESIPCS